MAFRFPFASWALVALASSAEAATGNAPGFTSGADVVVLVGLPGDVETEKAYQDQVRRLLALLARPECLPGRVHLLTDAPEAVTAPAGLKLEVAPATRDSVLALSRRIGGEAGPRVLFLWGHGGRQGEEPVFHVRGPRVTPEDLSRLVPREGASRLILFFRGSGAFARAVAGKERQVLASEGEMGFRSDPVGLDVALRLWADRPFIPFEELADLLGRETVAWYEERHLARQEEPTLWAGAAAPRSLARTASEQEKAAAPAAVPSPASQGDAWRGIAAVDPKSHPDADAVVLRSRASFVLGDDPAIRAESDEFVQVLTAEGTRRADVDLTFWPPGENLTLLDAEVRLPDGQLERFPVDELREASSIPADEYRGPSRKAFSLPGATPGAILRLHVQREWKRFPLPYVFLEVPIADESPVLDAELELRVASRSALHYAFRNMPASEPVRGETRYGRVYTWRFRDLAAPREEPLAPADRVPRLLFSTFPDWEAFASWYRGLIREADQLTPEIEARAREVTAGARTEREKVVALYNEVTRLRYVAIPLGVNSHRPHAAAKVLKNRYGDCKDKANLFNTLLHAVGIPADLVLVPRFTQADEAVPGLAFNHAISRVRLADAVIWADTTDDVSRFGLLPPGDAGRKVLVVGDGPAALTALPRPDPADHVLRLSGQVSLAGDAALPASFEARTSGFADYALRAAARASGAPRAAQPILGQMLRLSSGVFALTKQEQSPVTALEEPFVWKGEGSVHGLVSRVAGTDSSVLRAPFWLPREWDLALDARRSSLFLNQGYPLTLEEEIDLRLPKDAEAPTLPASRESASLPLRWTTRWTAPAPGVVRARLELRLASGELSLDETVAFQKQLGTLQQALAEGALLRTRHPERSAVMLSEAEDLVMAATRSFGPTPWDGGPQDDARAMTGDGGPQDDARAMTGDGGPQDDVRAMTWDGGPQDGGSMRAP